ncbi:MAG: UPF0280 family protein [Alphaproteobacteria bacterium]|nr:UPF0280 family protein [Alphaproteobacteria bacterium]
MMQAQRTTLDALRQRWWHGPIDLIVQAEGHPEVVEAAHQRAWEEFQGVLTDLVQELPTLRSGVRPQSENPCRGAVARTMWQACHPLATDDDVGFITPMAAVAGSVAQHLLRHYCLPGIDRAAINNGGDIALHLSPGSEWRLGLVHDADAVWLSGSVAKAPHQEVICPDGMFQIGQTSPVRGVATSGWSGRSLSRGIADSVTVLAADAACADAAATMIANRVDVDRPGIERLPANHVRDDSDLGLRLVTRHVPTLGVGEITTALQRGLAYAQSLLDCGLIQAALIGCQHQFVSCGHEVCYQSITHGETTA